MSVALNGLKQALINGRRPDQRLNECLGVASGKLDHIARSGSGCCRKRRQLNLPCGFLSHVHPDLRSMLARPNSPVYRSAFGVDNGMAIPAQIGFVRLLFWYRLWSKNSFWATSGFVGLSSLHLRAAPASPSR